MQIELVNAYTDALTRWLKAQKDHPGIYHGRQPNPVDYGFKTDLEIWQANEIERRVKREMERTE